MDKRWSKAEIAHLKNHAATDSVERLAQRVRTDVSTVRAKLIELGLTSNQSASQSTSVELFGKAVDLFNQKKWQQAADALEEIKLVSPDSHLADRAGQFLAICQQQIAGAVVVEDPYDRAVFAKNNGEFEAALEACRELGSVESDERHAYLAASIHALAGDEELALETLETAIRLEPKNRVHAYLDPDFESLDSHDTFVNLTAAP